jgi:hypothetical protein
MKHTLIVFLLAGSLAAFGQGRPGSHPAGPPSSTPGVGAGTGMGRGSASSGGMSGDHSSMGQSHAMSQTQQPLKDVQINGGAFRMLEKKTGMTSDQLQALYTSSGAKNFGDFVSAVVVSKNLKLDTNQVLQGLKTASLGQTLQNLGVDKKKAKEEIKKANQAIKDAGKES